MNIWKVKVTHRSWPDILRHYEQVEDQSSAPMCELVRDIMSSRYVTGLHGVTSMHTLLIANTPELVINFDVLRIDWDPGCNLFRFEFVEEPFVHDRWKKVVGPGEGFATLERFVRSKKWFVEYNGDSGAEKAGP